MSRLLKKRESSDTHTDLAKISFSYPPYKDLSGDKSHLARIPLESRAFLLFWGGGVRSVVPLSGMCILHFFRIWCHPFLTFPSGTSSINHQKFGALSPVLACSC